MDSPGKCYRLFAIHLGLRVNKIAVSNSNASHVINLNQLSLVKKGQIVKKVTLQFMSYRVTGEVMPTGDARCPVGLLLTYLQCCGRQPGPLFITQSGKTLVSSTVTVSSALAVCLHSLGLDISRYGTHSLRISGATTVAANGASDTQLHLIGRWWSNAFMGYVHPQNFSFCH